MHVFAPNVKLDNFDCAKYNAFRKSGCLYTYIIFMLLISNLQDKVRSYYFFVVAELQNIFCGFFKESKPFILVILFNNIIKGWFLMATILRTNA